MAHASPLLRAFADELRKIAAAPAPVPVQRIPSGPSPASEGPPRPPLPTAPPYRPPATTQAQQQSTPKRGGGAGKPVGSAWLSMADRAPTESTSRFVSRQYGVPERQMGTSQGKAVADANDPAHAQRFRTLWASTPITESYAPAVHTPEAKNTSTANVPAYLQRAVGGISHTPQPYTLRNGQAQPYGAVPASAPTTQPLQAGIR